MSTIDNIKNCNWANAEKTQIDCEIKHAVYGWMPFTASKTDSEEHGRMIFDACVAGEFGPIAEYVKPPEPKPNPNPKMVGVEFDGVMCSATSQDQSGLVAVLVAFNMDGANFQPTRFRFENGNSIVLNKNNILSFMAAWKPFRQSFFEV